MCFKMPSVTMPKVTTTARDLVSERSSLEPEAAVIGGSETSYADTVKQKGIASLQIKPSDKVTKSYNPVNTYFN